MRSRVDVTFSGGGVGLLYEWTDIGVEAWDRALLPLAELVAAAHPEAVWVATPIPDDMSDKEALSGHRT